MSAGNHQKDDGLAENTKRVSFQKLGFGKVVFFVLVNFPSWRNKNL